MSSNYENDRKLAEQTELKARNEAAVTRWLAKHPTVVDCIANRELLSEYFQPHVELDEGTLDFAYENNQNRMAHQTPPTVTEINKERYAMSDEELRRLARQETPQIAVPVLPAEWTRESLLSLVKKNIDAFKKLVELYGSTEIDQRMGVAKPKQPGYSVNMESFSRGEK